GHGTTKAGERLEVEPSERILMRSMHTGATHPVGLPLPTWGEGWGEGVTHYRWSCNPLTPALSPNGEREQTEPVAAALIESHRNVPYSSNGAVARELLDLAR